MKYCILVCLLLITACNSKADQVNYTENVEKVFSARLIKNIEDYKRAKDIACKNEAIEHAEKYVDSLLAIEFGMNATDYQYFPEKPNPPYFDSLDSIQLDTLPIKPFINPDSIPLQIEGNH